MYNRMIKDIKKYLNNKYFTSLLFSTISIVINSCTDQIIFKREIKNCAKTNKPGLLTIDNWRHNFYYMYEQVNVDSMIVSTDSLFIMLRYQQHYSTFSIFVCAKEWKYSLSASDGKLPLKKDYKDNYYNNRLLITMSNRKDSINLIMYEKKIAKSDSRNSILMLCTIDSKGKLKREIICN